MLNQPITIQQFKQKNSNELESDAYSMFSQYQDYLLEKIYVEDQRETVFLLNSFENIVKHNLPNIVNYHEIQYNDKERCVEVLRKYYETRLLEHPYRDKYLIIQITQQLFQTLATLEGFGIYLLGLKPTNIYLENDNIYISGFVRSEKFLLSQPMYQSKDLRNFIQECITQKKYNITQRYKKKSHAMIYSALVILIQFVLQEDFERIANLIRWLDNGDDNLKSVPSTEQLLEQIENKYDGYRIFVEQAKCLLVNEYLNPTDDLAIQFMLLASELRFEQDTVLLGAYYQEKPKPIQQIKQEPQKIEQKIETPQVIEKKNDVKKIKTSSKRCGGGFALKQKK